MTLKTPSMQPKSAVTRSAGKHIAGVAQILAKNDLDQMKQRSVILTDAAFKQLKLERETQEMDSRLDSQRRKRRIIEKELEVHARRSQNAMENELEAEQKAVLTGNEMVNNQHLESLRKINSLAIAASGYQLCDSLKEQKKYREGMESQYNRVHDSMMERCRRNDIQKHKDNEMEAHARRMEARKFLEEQIAERHMKADREEEAKDLEAQKILKTYKQFELEEQKKIKQQWKKQIDSRLEVVQTNKRIKQMKEQMVIRDKKEDMAAAAYLRKKELEEKAKLQELDRIRKSKELQIAKLRAQQEKALDKQAIQDELRAKKVYEETEKNMRLKEMCEKERKLALTQSIFEDRKKQEAFRVEHAQRLRSLNANTERIGQLQIERDYLHHKAAEVAAKEKTLQHGEMLKEQIELNQQHRIKAKIFEKDDAKFLKRKVLKESILAEKVRADTLQKLQKRGVPEEYLRELTRMKITEFNA